MKLSRIVSVLLVLALAAAPALAAEKTFGLGLQFDTGARDMAFDEFTSSLGKLTAAEITQMEKFYDYKETYHSIALLGTWNINSNFTARAILGLSDYELKGDYFGDQSNAFVGFKMSDDYSDFIYGLELDFKGPITDSWAVGLSLAGKAISYRDGSYSINGTQVLPGGAVTRVDVDTQKWAIEFFPRVIYTGKKVDLYIGPTYTMANAEMEVRQYTTAGVTTSTLTLEEEEPWAVRVGICLPLGQNIKTDIAVNFLGTTGATISASYGF